MARDKLLYLGDNPLLLHYLWKNRTNHIKPHKVRQILGAHLALEGLEVDHIIPKSVGGWDHPRNYCLVPMDLNRAWYNNWNAEKRAALGPTTIQSACSFAKWTTAQGEKHLVFPPPPVQPPHFFFEDGHQAPLHTGSSGEDVP